MVLRKLTVTVSLIYWTLLLFLPSLILLPADHFHFEPSSSATAPALFRIPLLLDLSLHAVPALSLLADFILFERKYGKNETHLGAPLVTLVATLWFSWWMEYCASFNGSCKCSHYVSPLLLNVRNLQFL